LKEIEKSRKGKENYNKGKERKKDQMLEKK
jgi:hypothetical protein